MCFPRKGVVQDAAVNPYKDGNSIAVIKNLGTNSFTIRLEYQGKLFQTCALGANKTRIISLCQVSVLNLDSDLAKVDFKKIEAHIIYFKI